MIHPIKLLVQLKFSIYRINWFEISKRKITKQKEKKTISIICHSGSKYNILTSVLMLNYDINIISCKSITESTYHHQLMHAQIHANTNETENEKKKNTKKSHIR